MVIRTIEYYQEGDKDAFTKVKRYGEWFDESDENILYIWRWKNNWSI